MSNMKKNLLIFSLILSFCALNAQIDSIFKNPFNKYEEKKNEIIDTLKKTQQGLENKGKEIIDKKKNELENIKKDVEDNINKNVSNGTSQIQNIVYEPVWDQGIPLLPDDDYVTKLTDQLDLVSVKSKIKLTEKEKSICREIGMAFYDKGLVDEANWYLSKSRDFHYNYQTYWEKESTDEEKPKEVSKEELQSIQSDIKFVNSIPKSLSNLTKNDLKNLAKQIDGQLKRLIAEKDSLEKTHASSEVIEAKNGTIKSLSKEKEIIDLTIVKEDLVVENKDLEVQKSKLKTYLIWASIGLSILGLAFLVLLQRKRIQVQDVEIDRQLRDINKKNTYLEHAARIIRHDMHSGINTYIPRGINSLEKRLSQEEIKNLKIDGSVKMIKEGLNHTQRVYKSVYEFTNLVKQNVQFEKTEINLKELLEKSILTTSYSSQVTIDELPTAKVNETLFWNAIDSLIKNGLKYNKSEVKLVKIYQEETYLVIEDNGLGLSDKKFKKIISMNMTDDGEESGLGLSICNAIIQEHGFELICDEVKTGTKMKIKLS